MSALNTINRMIAPLEQTIGTENSLDAFLDGIECLPPTPTVLIRLIDMFRRPDVDVDDIVQLLRRDPALSVEVLRRCNNSFFGNGSTIKDVNEAVYRLGFYEVYQITVTIFGMRVLTAPTIVPGFPAEELRRHSSIAAIAAGALARDVGLSEGVAFTTALLHDVGKLTFALAEKARYVALIGHCQRAGASLSQSEKQVFGFDHAEVGAHLLHRWGLPEEVTMPVLSHAAPAASGALEPLEVLTQSTSELANHIAANGGGVFSGTPEGKHLMEFFKLQANQLDGWEYLVRSKVKQLASLAS